MIKDIITDRNELLVKSEPANTQDPGHVMEVIKDLLDTARANDRCAGLAAVQIGYPVQVFVLRINPKKYQIIVDPEVLRKWGGKTTKPEGCLSVPDSLTSPIKTVRYKRIRIAFFDPEISGMVERNFNNFNARVVQHALDSFDGVVFGGE